MTSTNLRKMLSQIFADYNAFYGDNTGEMGEHDYKINYQLPNFDDEEGCTTHRLEIDIWTKDSIKVDELADEIKEKLSFYSCDYQNKWATFILTNGYGTDFEELHRKTLSYEVRTY